MMSFESRQSMRWAASSSSSGCSCCKQGRTISVFRPPVELTKLLDDDMVDGFSQTNAMRCAGAGYSLQHGFLMFRPIFYLRR